jgi:hypothetical protein
VRERERERERKGNNRRSDQTSSEQNNITYYTTIMATSSPLLSLSLDDDDNNEEQHHHTQHHHASSSLLVAPLLSRQSSSINNNDGNSNSNIYLEQILFFMAGLGSSIGYISSLSSLVYFNILYGNTYFVYLNCIIFLPLLPISIFQSLLDTKFDIKYKNSNITFLFRSIIGYGLLILGTIGIMILFWNNENESNENENETSSSSSNNSNSKQGRWVLFYALQQGIGGAILYGQLNQLSSFVGSLHTTTTNTTTATNTNTNTNDINDDVNNDNENENDTKIISNKFKATVSAGVQASAIIVLCISIGSGFYDTMTVSAFLTFLLWIILVEIICFLAYLWLLIAVPRVQISMIRRDTSMMHMEQIMQSQSQSQLLLTTSLPSSSELVEEEEEMIDLISNEDPMMPLRQPLLLSSSTGTASSTTSNNNAILSLYEILYHSRYCCLGMGLTLIPSFLVGSWFTRIETDWMMLAQILFYIRIGFDLLGRIFTLWVPPKSISYILWIASIRWIAVILFFINSTPTISIPIVSKVLPTILVPTTQRQRDLVSILLVAYIAFCSGYLVTSLYQLAPQQLPSAVPVVPVVSLRTEEGQEVEQQQQQLLLLPREGQRQRQGVSNTNTDNTNTNTNNTNTVNATKQSSILTVAFSISAICGLLLSFTFIAIDV